MRLKETQDAFGQMMWDHLHGRGGFEIVERSDGLFNVSAGPGLYFAPYEEWMETERQAMTFVRGKVLDIGCGAGRHALHLQEKGHDVMGIDTSPLAVKVCRARGVRNARVLSLTQVSRRLGVFDTILMMGNNFGLLGKPKRARWLFRRFARMTPPDGRIIAFTRDPYQTDLPEHTDFHAWNKQHGRMGGEARIRIRYKKFVTPWIDFLMVSQEELHALLAETAWQASTFLNGNDGIYAAILNKREVSGHTQNKRNRP